MKKYKIGNIEPKNILSLAPMAGFTDSSFRTLCKEHGVGILISEMVSAKGLYYKDKKTIELMRFTELQRPFGIQIFGSEPDILAYAAKACEAFGADFVDFNMGCPTPKIVSNGDGSALMKNPALVAKCIDAAVRAVSVPVTVKMRLGWDENSINAPEIAKIAQECGASAITVHGRTRAQMYSPPVSLTGIKEVVEAVSVPVIGNGDITDAESAEKMLKETGCQGLMIGRGAIGNPFIFEELLKYFETGEKIRITPAEKIDEAIKHLMMIADDKGEAVAVREAKKHIACYIKGMKDSHIYKCRVFEAKTVDEMKEILSEVREACI